MQAHCGVKCLLFAVFFMFLGFAMPSHLLSATYYVDPLAGSDINDGLSRGSAWKSVPGTYKLDNSGFLFVPGMPTGWVMINGGDVIKIRSGTTILNKLVVDSTWYNNGTSSAPIFVTRDDTWDTGPVTFEGSQQTLDFWDTMILVWSRDYVWIDGVSTDGIIIQNVNGRGFQGTGTSESLKMKGLTVKNVRFFNNEKFNVSLQRCDSFYFENIDIDGNRRDTEVSGGFQIGGNSYGCSNGRLVNCRSYNHGSTPGTQGGGTDARIGFWLTNSFNVTYENCVAYDNEGHGFDAGVVGNPPSIRTDNIKYVNCEAYNNTAGFSSNLDDIPGAARFWYINCVSKNNYAGWMVYDGASSHVYNCLTTGNQWGIYLDSVSYINRNTFIDMKNTIFYKNSRGWPGVYTWDMWFHRVEDIEGDSDYNHFEQGSQSTCIAWNGAVEWSVYYYNSSDAPGSTLRRWYQDGGVDGHSLCSLDGEFARFVDEGNGNYRLTSSSSLVGRGTVIGNSAIPEIQKDKDGNLRPAGGPWDIGPYQYIPLACVYSIFPIDQSFKSGGGTGSVDVSTTAACGWTAISNNSWITITSGASGTGSGTVGYSVAANTGVARTGSMTIAGQSFTVNQASAAIPDISVSPSSLNFGFVRRGRSSSKSVTVRNTGAGLLNISSISITGINGTDFSQTNNCLSLAQNASCTIRTTFSPTGVGTRRATLSIYSNDPNENPVNVPLRGTGY